MQSGPQQPRSPDGVKRNPGRSTVADFLDSRPGLHPGYEAALKSTPNWNERSALRAHAAHGT
jgi:hypothetical protein